MNQGLGGFLLLLGLAGAEAVLVQMCDSLFFIKMQIKMLNSIKTKSTLNVANVGSLSDVQQASLQ